MGVLCSITPICGVCTGPDMAWDPGNSVPKKGWFADAMGMIGKIMYTIFYRQSIIGESEDKDLMSASSIAGMKPWCFHHQENNLILFGTFQTF